MLAADGTNLRIELDDEIIRFVGTRGSDYHAQIRVSSIVDVSWKEPGVLHGMIRFLIPGEKSFKSGDRIPVVSRNEDGYVFFGRNSLDEFRAFRDAVEKLIQEARHVSVQLSALLKPNFVIPITTPETRGIETRRNLRLGEIRREFDKQTEGLIQGTMHHELGLHGGFTSISLGRIGLGLGQIGLSGTTGVNLQAHSTTRSDFLNDGFVAIFDEPSQTSIPETLRVIVPSEEACGEYVRSLYAQMGLNRFDPRQDQLKALTTLSIPTDISYVSDRLGAALRMNSDKPPVFNVVGVLSGPHTMLGGAIQMPGDDRWLQLFPVGLLRALSVDSNTV